MSEPSNGVEAGQGKGRPTPKRREAQKRRRQPLPSNRKDAAKVRRERVREARGQQRKALQTGDEKHLPARDAGPAKRLARDIVDSRFTLGQIFFGLILVTLVLTIVTTPSGKQAAKQSNTIGAFVTVISILVLIAVFTDSIRVGRRARRAVIDKLGDKHGLGITGYAAIRAMQPRRMRRPPAAVKRGQPPR